MWGLEQKNGSPALWVAPKNIPYTEWIKDYGKYRWIHENGDARVFGELKGEWKELYDIVTSSADMRFHDKTIETDDIDWFTSEFLHQVPYSWMRFKTTLMFFFGNLSGTEMNTDFFNGIVNRWITHEGGRGTNVNGSSSGESAGTNNRTVTQKTTYGEVEGTTKGRNIQYAQGVQKYAGTELRPENIGELGRDYATGFNDTIGTSYQSIHDDNGTTTSKEDSSQKTSGTSSAKSQMEEKFTDHEITNRVQYYPMLSYLKTRVEMLDYIESFDNELLKLFRRIDSYKYFF